ncbi:hypothetical protein [Vogesella fluminis]|uniref:DUF262 domain-containing protein n=1 Tax=Vogesella fluminis TaxID=1069161 RepID=A0ABQ3H971_9NEIS|nr:hypothetical protein [Vogesella fluminis]GHD70888.1 hypothetical protein GCM10011419_01780 [Vogesella fluminis]
MDSTLFKKVDYSLGKLMQGIAIGSLGLPDIQRPFVWPNAKVRDLFDKGYRTQRHVLRREGYHGA